MSDLRATPCDIAVVVVTFNSAAQLPLLANSLASALGTLTWRGLVVDNQSTDGTPEVARRLGLDVLPMDWNRGYSAGLNTGIRAIPHARYYLLLNADLELMPGCIPALLAGFRNPGVGIAIPQLRHPSGELLYNQRRWPSPLRAMATALLGGLTRHSELFTEHVTDSARYLADANIDWGVGAAMLISRQCLNEVGPWDETYFLYAEEVDYCARAAELGFTTRYVAQSVIRHEGGEGAQNPRLRSMMTVNRVRQYSRGHSTPFSAAFYLSILLNEVLRGVIMGDEAARSGALALVRPSRRPKEIGCSDSLLPS